MVYTIVSKHMNETDREKEIKLLKELIDKSNNEKMKMFSKG